MAQYLDNELDHYILVEIFDESKESHRDIIPFPDKSRHEHIWQYIMDIAIQ